MKHYTLPIFIPEEGCPHRCVFCSQSAITGQEEAFSSEKLTGEINQILRTLPHAEEAEIQLGFFGGNFTGLSFEVQRKYLESVLPWIQSGKIHSIRLSTRPDAITAEKLEFLKAYPVTHIELGAQSFDSEVLRLSGRGHTAEQTENASALVLNQGFALGLQMMLGLPGDSAEKALETARKIVAAGASETRVYPTLVFRNTELESRYLKGDYTPLSLEEAVRQAADTLEIFEKGNLRILKVGLHPSENLKSEKDFRAGPFHVNFREMAETEIWKRIFLRQELSPSRKKIQISVAPCQFNAAVGFQGSNKNLLLKFYSRVHFRRHPDLQKRDFLLEEE